MPRLCQEVREARGVRRVAAGLMLALLVVGLAAMVITVIAQVMFPLVARSP